MVTVLRFFDVQGWRGLKLSGRVDAFNDRQIIQSLELAIQDADRVVIDLSDAEFLSFQVLRALTFFNLSMGRKGGELALVRPSHSVRRQIEIFLGNKAFRIYGSQEELKAGHHVLPRAEFHSSPSEASTTLY